MTRVDGFVMLGEKISRAKFGLSCRKTGMVFLQDVFLAS